MKVFKNIKTILLSFKHFKEELYKAYVAGYTEQRDYFIYQPDKKFEQWYKENYNINETEN